MLLIVQNFDFTNMTSVVVFFDIKLALSAFSQYF